METAVCMNGSCGASSSSVGLKKGWPLRCGGFAALCDKCGTAYEQLAFCDTFHSEETGWRECSSCGKRLHCGCIASSTLLELLDGGGVSCMSCSKGFGSHHRRSIPCDEKPKLFVTPAGNNEGESALTATEKQCTGINEKIKKLDSSSENDGQMHTLKLQREDSNGSLDQMKQDEILASLGEAGSSVALSLNHASIGSSYRTKVDVEKETFGVSDLNGSLVQTNLTISLGSPSVNPNSFSGVLFGERELNKLGTSFQQGLRSRHLLPKPPNHVLASGVETNTGVIPQIRVARPPVEGRIKNQLLPRYWPRITDQELQQISGDSNATIVPLFEKVLSASDAGRIGRLVLPKACAEAYFPPISQPEGLPLRIQDVKGKEWVFQFRFWPNNNSRMYVLEGVTPCIQSMQLQAGDTVTFSRMDPEGKLLMGFRKASTTITLQSIKGSTNSSLNTLPTHTHNGDFNWHISEQSGKMRDGPLSPSVQVPEGKRIRNIGSKSKRLLIDSQDALELKLSWEELQDIFWPPPNVTPTVVTIEDYIFEEYEDPPVFGKRSIFTVRLSGEKEQWAQCDNCFKWRRLPSDILLPPKWTCQDKIGDQKRSMYLCSLPEELGPLELENLLKMHKDFKRQKTAASNRTVEEHESVGLDTLNNGKAAGSEVGGPGAASVATTTKHPRHRPGCSCIVCIQPPSGKGKHKPTCTCNVCMTVKRRFKTLMMRKKKRQSEREAEIAQRSRLIWGPKEEAEADSIARQGTLQLDSSENEVRMETDLQPRIQSNNWSHKIAETAKGQLDLNCHPDREDSRMGTSRVSMMSLLQEASLPLEKYLRQNGLTSLMSDQQASSGSHAPPQAAGESEGLVPEECSPTCAAQEQDEQDREAEDDDLCGPDQNPKDP